MISVGIKELKNNLSEYLQYVKNGENIYITKHNKIIAEISLPKENTKSKNEDELEKLRIQGKIIKAKRNSSIIYSKKILE